MTDRPSARRRWFLRSAGVGSAALLAGCSALDSNDTPEDTSADSQNGTDDETTDDRADDDQTDEKDTVEEPTGDEREVGLAVSVGFDRQQSLQQTQMALRRGKLSQDEAEAQFADILAPVFDDVVATVESETDVSVVERVPLAASARAIGPPDDLIDLLDVDGVGGLLSAGDLTAPDQPGP